MGGEAAEMAPEEELRHYNNMQQQRVNNSRDEREEPARPAMSTPRVRPPSTGPTGPPPPMSGQEMTEAKLLQRLGPLSMGGTGPTRKSMAFAKAWGILKTGEAPKWSSTDQGYEEDPLLQGEDDLGDEPRLTAHDPIDPKMEMSDEDYLNMLLGQARGPKMGELADEGAEMGLGDIGGMGEEGERMARHHMDRGPAAGQSRARPPIDVPPAPPQRPPRGQRTLDEF